MNIEFRKIPPSTKAGRLTSSSVAAIVISEQGIPQLKNRTVNGRVAVYKVPEDLRLDAENYRIRIEKDNEKRRKNGAYTRYARRKVNKEFGAIIKITLVLIVGFVLITALCKVSETGEAQKAKNSNPENNVAKSQSDTSFYHAKNISYYQEQQPIAYATNYVQVPIYSQSQNQSYTIWQPVINQQQTTPGKQFTYVDR